MSKNQYLKKLKINNKSYFIFALNQFLQDINQDITKLPYSHRILFENYIRSAILRDEFEIAKANIKKYFQGDDHVELSYFPARVLMQDFTGVPAVVDLASMRQAVHDNGGNPELINPIAQVDLVIDHSVQVDFYKNTDALAGNIKMELKRNKERYEFLKWGQSAFNNFKVVPPGMGICHQVNLEYLAHISYNKSYDFGEILFPDSLVGTDSHTTMINGVGVFGFGVGGIEAEAAMLGQELSMVVPKVVGFKLIGELKEGVTATDLVLTICEKLRQAGVVGKFVEFYGEALDHLAIADRATIANMTPEFGATMGYFPVDDATISYMKFTARSDEIIERTKAYFDYQEFARNQNDEIQYEESMILDLADVKPCLAGPRLPQERVNLDNVAKDFTEKFDTDLNEKYEIKNKNYEIQNGDVAIAAITSCTNTSNPNVMIAAGLVAKKAVEKGLEIKPFVKSSLAPGSQVVTEYLNKAGLTKYLDELGFNNVGYGCTTCIGNSGPLNQDIEEIVHTKKMIVASVLSGNRNFEGRVHPYVKASYLASPPLVVAYALLGNVREDITKAVIGIDNKGNKVFLKDIWPSNDEVKEYVKKSIDPQMFANKYAKIFEGDQNWSNLNFEDNQTYHFNENSSYVKNPPFFNDLKSDKTKTHIDNARILAIFADNITTDHISPAGTISGNSAAALYLSEKGIGPKDFNSYGSRRGNHEVMMRGTFANTRIKNEMLAGKEGSYTYFLEDGMSEMSIYDASMLYQEIGEDLVVIAGQNYGAGSSRDWAAKGTKLLGVKAVIAESFERIHRSNLVGMGVLPLMFKGYNRNTLNLTGHERITIYDIDKIEPSSEVKCLIEYEDGYSKEIHLVVRVDTVTELDNYNNGGVLQKVVKQVLSSNN